MELVYIEISLSNPKDDQLKPLIADALVDTGAITLCIPDHIAVQLNLEEIEQRDVTTADGKYIPVPYVGPVQVQFENRTCFTGALVLGDSVLLGAVPMEVWIWLLPGLTDPGISSRMQKVTVNPESPNMPSALVK
ncbi:MAG: clan AA aspartic protease [Methylococcales bacterium]